MATRGQTTAPHGHGTLRLSGSVLSPYFQTVAYTREEAPDRDSNLSLDSMAKKVMIGALVAPVTSETSFTCALAGYDDSGGEVLHENQFTIPLTNGTSTDELVNYLVSFAVTWANASPRSYGITAADVIRPAAMWVPNGVTGAPLAAIADAPADAVTNYNVLTTLLGTLTGAVNDANTKQNDIATKLNAIISRLETLGLIAT